MKLRIAVSSVALAACLAKVKPERMPDGRQALRIECNYNLDNCKRKARQECHGDYEDLGTGDASCKECGGWQDTRLYPQPPRDNHTAPEGNNVFKGVLYVRCL